MITDEQVKAAAELIAQNWSDNEAKARKILENYEQSKWVKFDINDPVTYPPLETDVACDEGYAVYLLRRTEKEFAWKFSDSDDTPAVTHWQPLPTFNP